MISSTLFIR